MLINELRLAFYRYPLAILLFFCGVGAAILDFAGRTGSGLFDLLPRHHIGFLSVRHWAGGVAGHIQRPGGLLHIYPAVLGFGI